jgi:hypothetical protein
MPSYSIDSQGVLPAEHSNCYCPYRAATNYFKVMDTLLHGISSHLIKHATILTFINALTNMRKHLNNHCGEPIQKREVKCA